MMDTGVIYVIPLPTSHQKYWRPNHGALFIWIYLTNFQKRFCAHQINFFEVFSPNPLQCGNPAQRDTGFIVDYTGITISANIFI